MTVVDLVERERGRLRVLDTAATIALHVLLTTALLGAGAWLLGNTRWIALPRATSVTLGIFDLQGRRVASPLTSDHRSAGIHIVPVRTDGWREGFYFCRFEADGATETRKFVVLR